jgi:hypothetical protein
MCVGPPAIRWANILPGRSRCMSFPREWVSELRQCYYLTYLPFQRDLRPKVTTNDFLSLGHFFADMARLDISEEAIEGTLPVATLSS